MQNQRIEKGNNSKKYCLINGVLTIVLHSFFGQTLGKKIMSVKLYNLNEVSLLSVKRSFYRESVWILGQLFILIFFTIKMFKLPESKDEYIISYNNNVALFTIIWIIIELIFIATNSKKRSIQDFMANSVLLRT